MIKFSELLTGKIPGREKNKDVPKQKLAAAMAWQILHRYPQKRKSIKEWKKYENLRGVLLADEVGGGKTFEALAIISKAFLEKVKSKRDRFRVLIIVAPAIRSKWEWKEEKNKIDKECDLKKFLKQSNLLPKNRSLLESFLQTAQEKHIIKSSGFWNDKNQKRQGIWITSFGRLPKTQRDKDNNSYKFLRSFKFYNFFDYIISDEFHIVRSGYKDKDITVDDNQKRLPKSAIRKIKAVLNENTNAKLLMLTATPFQNNLHEFKHILKFTDESYKMDNKGNDKYGKLSEIIVAGLDVLDKKIQYLKDGNLNGSKETRVEIKELQDLVKAFDNQVKDLIKNDHDIDNSFKYLRPKDLIKHPRKSGLDDFIADVMIRNDRTQLETPSYKISIEDLAKRELNENEKLQYLLLRDIISVKREIEDEKEMYPVKLSQLVSSGKAFEKSFNRNPLNSKKQKHDLIKNLFKENLLFEKKYAILNDLIEKRFQDKRIKVKNVIVVFTDHLETISALSNKLKKESKDYSVEPMTGEKNDKERKKLLERIDKESKFQKTILLVSRIGNEGLDFDGFSNSVIHFDGHYNPAVIDQRNGRVYRGNNKYKDIFIDHIYLKETYDQRIKFIELEKRKLKNFFLGNGNLHELMTQILSKNDLKEKRRVLKELEKIKFDFAPREEYLLKMTKRQL